jgi:exopolysaccharide biosynthesis polyprenyl glycosylphosphotransferase
MHNSKRQFLVYSFKVFDIAIMLMAMTCSFILAEMPRNGIVWPHDLWQMNLQLINVLLLLFLVCIWHLVFLSMGLYDSRRFDRGKGEYHDVLKAVVMGSMLLLVVAVLFRRKHINRDMVLYFAALSWSLTCISRFFLRLALGWVRVHNRNLRRLLLVGSNRRGMTFARRVQARSQLGYRVVGYIDDVCPPDCEGSQTTSLPLPYLGCLAEFDEVLNRQQIDEVVIALPIRSFYEPMKRIIHSCECQGIQVHLLSDFFQLHIARARSAEFDGIPLLTLSTHNVPLWPGYMKRAFDVVMAGMAIVLLSPVFFLVALLIKLWSPGPVFFVQDRVGYNRRPFRMIKFRSMVPNAHLMQKELEMLNEAQGPVFKIRNDPRITPIGRFLRKTSLDELPQLFNVLCGDMSLVGPRPLPLRDVEQFEESYLNRRFSVKPGITCLWQVNGRTATHASFGAWIEQDLEYIDHWSFALDLKILARTIPAVLRGTDAY